MKEKDFDEIGKRLHDLEAEPPKNGWKRVGATLQNPPTGKMVGIKKFWWLPFLILVPVALYYTYPTKTNKPSDAITETIHMTLSVDPAVDSSSQNSQIENAAIDQENPEVSSTHASLSQQTNPKKERNTENENDFQKNTQARSIDQKANPSDIVLLNGMESAKPFSRNEKMLETKENKSEINNPSLTSDSIGKNVTEKLSRVSIEVVEPKNDLKASFDSKDIKDSTVDINLPITLAPTTANLTLDTAAGPQPPQETVQQKQDSVAKAADEIIRKKESFSKWRWSVALSPQYITQLVKPLANDEVLVTDIRNATETKNVGYQLAAGIGKSLTESFWLDAQVQFTSLQQDMFYSSHTGKVDTLLAVLQADQTVRVTPVFSVADREVISKVSYGGLQLNGNYYFWATSRRRFNLQASASAQYVLKNSAREKIDGRWVALPSDGGSKLNMAFTIGGGYNWWISPGWELTINPTLTYYLKELKNPQLPYNINQRTVGLNFTLTKLIQ